MFQSILKVPWGIPTPNKDILDLNFKVTSLNYLGRLGAGVDRKCLVRSTKFFNVYLLIFFAFQGHLELLGCLGAGVNGKYLVRSTKFFHVSMLFVQNVMVTKSGVVFVPSSKLLPLCQISANVLRKKYNASEIVRIKKPFNGYKIVNYITT